VGHPAHPRSRRALSAGLALLVCLAATAAVASGRNAQVDKARQLIEDAEFDQAIRVINDALIQPDNSDAMLVSLYELQGTAYLYQGKEDRARQAFEKLLQASPEHELTKGTSSKIRALFEKVREDLHAQKLRPVKVSHTRLKSARPGERLDVKAQFTDIPTGCKARLYYRRAGTEGYSSTTFVAEGDGSVARIPAFELPSERGDYALEYYLEVADSGGRRLAGVADALSPISVHVASSAPDKGAEGGAAEVSEAWYQKWWVWTIVGAVAIGAGVGVGVGVEQLNNRHATLPVTIKVQ
jgi:tetratricopeptide (TPR) repeat protein